MFGLRNNLQVLWAVISLIAVDVVNVFASFKLPAYHFLHHQAVLIDAATSGHGNPNVTAINTLSAIPEVTFATTIRSAEARPTAKSSIPISHIGRVFIEGIATTLTRKRDFLALGLGNHIFTLLIGILYAVLAGMATWR